MTNRTMIHARGITSRVWANLSASFNDCFPAGELFLVRDNFFVARENYIRARENNFPVRDRIFLIINPLCTFVPLCLCVLVAYF
jgi:hypothetical protein